MPTACKISALLGLSLRQSIINVSLVIFAIYISPLFLFYSITLKEKFYKRFLNKFYSAVNTAETITIDKPDA